jgi:hypothetical protein
MTKPSPYIIMALANSIRQHPELLEWLLSWKAHELEQLPHAITNPALSQGRCQVLGEICKLAKDAPELAAKL